MYLAEKIAKWIVIGGAMLLAFSPFFVTPETAFPAVFLRAILVRIIIEIMLVAYLFLALFFPEYRPRKSTIAYAVGAFLFVFLLSTIFGVNPYRSFWGSHERMEGYVTLLHFGALFLALFGTLKTPDEFKKVFWLSLIAFIPETLYAFGQIPGIDIQKTKLYANETTRISGHFGNATIFALYVLFQLFFAVILFFWETGKWRRRVLVGIGGLASVALYYSGTRGAVLGAALGLFVVLFALALWSKHRTLRLVGIVLLVAGLVGGSALIFLRNSSVVQHQPFLARILEFGTPHNRLTAWGTGIDAWKHRFWLGYGIENFNYAFNRFYKPEMVIFDKGDFDRAHNRFVDSLVTGGFLGLVTHLAVFATAGFFLLRKWRANRTFFVPLAALALLVAYPIQLFFLFDHMISYQVFAIFLAFLAVWQTPLETSPDGTSGLPRKRGSLTGQAGFTLAFRWLVVGGATVGMAVFTWHANIRPVEASYWAQVATNTNYVSQGQKFPEAFGALKKSFDMNTYLNVDMRLALHGFASSQAVALQGEEGEKLKREVLEYLAEQFQKNLAEHHPDIKDFLAHTTYARIAGTLAEYDPSWEEKALAVLEAGVEEYPRKYQLFQALARLYTKQGKYNEAVRIYEQYQACPFSVASDGTFRLRATWEGCNHAPPSLLFEHAALLLNLGRVDEARPMLQDLVRIGYDFSRNLQKLVDIFIQSQDYGMIALLYENQLAQSPDDVQLMASLAETYRKMGDIASARRVAEMLLAKNPEGREEIEEFLRALEATQPGM